MDLNSNAESRAQLLRAAEEAKIQLSHQGQAQGVVRAVAHGVDGRELDLEYQIGRPEFEAMIGEQIDRALSLTSEVLAQANLAPAALDEVAMVGGSTLIPVVRRRVKHLFGREPLTNVNPLEAVAVGAALHAHNEAFWTRVAALAQTLDTLSYYHLLGVAQDAPIEAIEAAYYRRAANVHPDRHAYQTDPQLRRALVRLYARFGEAIRVLRSPALREAYDRELASGRSRLSDEAEQQHRARGPRRTPRPSTPASSSRRPAV